MASRSRRWAATLNNPEVAEEFILKQMMDPRQPLSFLIYGREIAPGTGTPHLQIYLETKKRHTLTGLKAKLRVPRLHLEIAKGTAEQNIAYVTKDGGEGCRLGTPMKPGKRNDLDDMRNAIQDGMNINDVAENWFGNFLRYHQGISAFYSLQRKEQEAQFDLSQFPWNLEYPEGKSLVLWGEAGIGKTEFAKALLKENYLFVSHLDQLKSFDGSWHSGIIFDDMSFMHIPREAQIALVDWDNDRAIHIRYGVGLIPKGTKKIFTTNVTDGEIFDRMDKAIARRIKVHHLVG